VLVCVVLADGAIVGVADGVDVGSAAGAAVKTARVDVGRGSGVAVARPAPEEAMDTAARAGLAPHPATVVKMMTISRDVANAEPLRLPSRRRARGTELDVPFTLPLTFHQARAAHARHDSPQIPHWGISAKPSTGSTIVYQV